MLFRGSCIFYAGNLVFATNKKRILIDYYILINLLLN